MMYYCKASYMNLAYMLNIQQSKLSSITQGHRHLRLIIFFSLNDKTLKDYTVHDQSAENLSSDVPVSATLNTIIESKKKPEKNTSKSI